MLKYFVTRTALLLRIHHIQKVLVLPKLFDETPPFGFVVYLTLKYLIFYHLPKIYAVGSLPQPLLLCFIILILFFCLQDVVNEGV